MYANKLVTARRAFENKNTSRSQVMEPGPSNKPPNLHYNLLFEAPWWRGFRALVSQYVPFTFKFKLIDVGRVYSAYERWKNGVKSKGRVGARLGGGKAGNEWKKIERLCLIGTAMSLPQRVSGHRKVGLLTGCWKAVFRWPCQAVLEIRVTCLTACLRKL
eukprot:49367-Pelagomonas_calceolata.AAC.1